MSRAAADRERPGTGDEAAGLRCPHGLDTASPRACRAPRLTGWALACVTWLLDSTPLAGLLWAKSMRDSGIPQVLPRPRPTLHVLSALIALDYLITCSDAHSVWAWESHDVRIVPRHISGHHPA